MISKIVWRQGRETKLAWEVIYCSTTFRRKSVATLVRESMLKACQLKDSKNFFFSFVA